MKRVELLEALALQGKTMRELSKLYSSIKLKNGNKPSADGVKVLRELHDVESEFDRTLNDLEGWWDKHLEISEEQKNELEEMMVSPEYANPVEITIGNVTFL